MVKVRNIVYDNDLLQQAVLEEKLYELRIKERIAVLEYLNFFNKISSELLAVDVKIDEEDKALIFLSSLLESYDHIIISILYGNETLILENVTITLNEIRKGQIKMSQKVKVCGHGKKRNRSEEKEEEERKVRIRQKHLSFVTRKVIRRRTASIDKSG